MFFLLIMLICLTIKLANAQSWTATTSLTDARYSHTATLLTNGNVLVAGGCNGGQITGVCDGYLSSVELYNPSTGVWTVTDSLIIGRWYHTATLLSNGNVLIAGGYYGGYLSSVELYNLTTGVWTGTGSLTTARDDHTATLLPNGNVLVAGGCNGGQITGVCDGYLSSVELYNPSTGVWTVTGSLTTARDDHTATLLPNGNVLVAAGYNLEGLDTAELYNVITGVWTGTGDLTTARYSQTATLLANGNVLICGGAVQSSLVDESSLTSAELYIPQHSTEMLTPTAKPTPTPLTVKFTATSTATFSTLKPTTTVTRRTTGTPTATATTTKTATATKITKTSIKTATATVSIASTPSTPTLSFTTTSTATKTSTCATTPTPTSTPSSSASVMCPSLQSSETIGFGSFNVTSANTMAIGFCFAGFTGSPLLFCDVNGNWNLTSLLNPCAKVQVVVINVPTFSPTFVSNLSYVSTGSVSFSNGSLYLGSGSSSIGSFYFNQSLIPAITSIPQDLAFSVVFDVSTDCNPCSGGIAFVVEKSASLSSMDVNFPFYSSSTAVINPYVAVVVNVGTQSLGVYTTKYSTLPKFFIPFQLTGSNIFVWVDYLLDQELPVLQISFNLTGSEKPLQPSISNIFNLTSVDNLGTAALPIYQGFFGFTFNSTQTNSIASVQSLASQTCPVIAADPTFGTPSFPSTTTNSAATGVCPSGWQGKPERLCNAQGMWIPLVIDSVTEEYNCSLISPTSSQMCSSIQASDNSSFASFNATNSNTIATGFCQAGFTGSPSLFCDVNGNWNFNSLSGSCVMVASSSTAGAIAGGIIGALAAVILIILLLWFLRSRYWNNKDMNKSDYYRNPMFSMTRPISVRSSSQFSDARQSEDIYISFNSLKLGAVLGQGHFGQVYQADYTGAQVAVKKAKGVKEKLILEEATMMKNIPLHPNVLHYYGVSQDNGEFMMVTELCDKGNLAQYLRNPNNNLTPQQCRQFCRQIASGMWHVSKYGIIHRDLRAENILLSGDNNLVAKVGDFGLARSLNSHDPNDSSYYRMTELKPIPFAWTPPEVLNQSDQLKYVAASDVWSFGIVMWEIYSRGAKPFEKMDVNVVISIITEQHRITPLLPRPDDCPDDIFNIMNSCWAFNPQDRPTFEQLYNQLS